MYLISVDFFIALDFLIYKKEIFSGMLSRQGLSLQRII